MTSKNVSECLKHGVYWPLIIMTMNNCYYCRCLVQFFKMFPELKQNDFYLTGEVQYVFLTWIKCFTTCNHRHKFSSNACHVLTVLRWQVHTIACTPHSRGAAPQESSAARTCNRRRLLRSAHGNAPASSFAILIDHVTTCDFHCLRHVSARVDHVTSGI